MSASMILNVDLNRANECPVYECTIVPIIVTVCMGQTVSWRKGNWLHQN